MLECKPIQDKRDQAALCDACGVRFREECFAYGATEDGKQIGICQFTIKGEYGHIFELACVKGTNDSEALFIMGRGVMNFIDIAGAHEAFWEGDDSPLVRALGFADRDGKLYIDLGKFFENPCKSKK